MKKGLIMVAAVLLSISALAQTKHLKFKGIPIDGDYKTFAQKLVQKGFKQVESTADGIVLTGNFMATSGVMVLVYPDPTSKKVSTVSAMIETGDNWPTIEGKYYDVVDIYKEKYGEPTQHVEEFTVNVHNDDFFRKNALHEGQSIIKPYGRQKAAASFFRWPISSLSTTSSAPTWTSRT